MSNYKIIKFKHENIELDIRVKNHSLWLSVEQLSTLFGKSRSTISKHIKNIFAQTELKKSTSCAKIAHQVGGQKHYSYLYNLDVVLLVGYRLNSTKAEILKEYFNEYVSGSKENIELKNNNIVIYDNGFVHIPFEVSQNEKTLYATQEQISDLFETTRENVNYHIKNIFKDNELSEKSICKEILHMGSNGRKYKTVFYNFILFLFFGYRVKTSKAIAFRNWASSVLKEYILKGYSLNEVRCIECRNDLVELKDRVIKLEGKLEKEITFTPGEELISFSAIERFLRNAKKEIIIFDNYFGHDFDSVLSSINVKKVIVTNSKNTKIESNENYKVIKTNLFHDRYIIVDDICYHFGQSFAELGSKIASASKISDEIVINVLKGVEKNENN